MVDATTRLWAREMEAGLFAFAAQCLQRAAEWETDARDASFPTVVTWRLAGDQAPGVDFCWTTAALAKSVDRAVDADADAILVLADGRVDVNGAAAEAMVLYARLRDEPTIVVAWRPYERAGTRVDFGDVQRQRFDAADMVAVVGGLERLLTGGTR